jgi:curved DNA-binding protein CbpA
MRRYYEVLDISENATEAEIKKAYRRMAMKFHPDRNPDDAEAADKFREVQSAYECLSDPERRKIYDETGDASVQQGNPAEDLFLHLLNEISDHFETAAEVLEKIRGVISEMLDECAERKLSTDRRIVVVQAMLKAVRFKGKGSNVMEGVLGAKLLKLQAERSELDQATTAGKAVYDMLKDYEATDRPLHQEQYDTATSFRIKAMERMMQDVFGGRANQTGRRRGGMPFSGV